MSTDQAIEQQIQEALDLDKTTYHSVQASILDEAYFTASDGVVGSRVTSDARLLGGLEPVCPSFQLVTFCVLTLRNGFIVTGESVFSHAEGFSRDVAEMAARQAAVAKIWSLMENDRLNKRLAAQVKRPYTVSDIAKYEIDQHGQQLIVEFLDGSGVTLPDLKVPKHLLGASIERRLQFCVDRHNQSTGGMVE